MIIPTQNKDEILFTENLMGIVIVDNQSLG